MIVNKDVAKICEYANSILKFKRNLPIHPLFLE